MAFFAFQCQLHLDIWWCQANVLPEFIDCLPENIFHQLTAMLSVALVCTAPADGQGSGSCRDEFCCSHCCNRVRCTCISPHRSKFWFNSSYSFWLVMSCAMSCVALCNTICKLCWSDCTLHALMLMAITCWPHQPCSMGLSRLVLAGWHNCLSCWALEAFQWLLGGLY